MAALLHGHLQEAMQWNAMLVVLLPFACFLFVMTYWRAIHADEFDWPRISDRWLTAALLVTAAFTVMRNLPLL